MMLIIFQGDVNSVEIGRRRGSKCGRTEGYRQQSPWVTNIIFKTNFLASSSLCSIAQVQSWSWRRNNALAHASTAKGSGKFILINALCIVLHDSLLQRAPLKPRYKKWTNVQGCSKKPQKTECPECDPIAMINKKLEKLIKCASKEEKAAQVVWDDGDASKMDDYRCHQWWPRKTMIKMLNLIQWSTIIFTAQITIVVMIIIVTMRSSSPGWWWSSWRRRGLRWSWSNNVCYGADHLQWKGWFLWDLIWLILIEERSSSNALNWQRSCQGWWGDQKSLPTDCWLRRWDWPTERFPINRYFAISNMKGFVATHMQVLTPSMVSRASGTRLTKSSRTFWTKARMTAMKIARRNSTRLSKEICEG